MVTRKNCRDIWNAYMAENATFCTSDIPYCPTTAKKVPTEIITWEEAKSRYKKNLSKNKDFQDPAFVCFYLDDYRFDGPRGIWHDSSQALRILSHFGGLITPDFSTYQDFPIPIKMYATYRMRLFGYWAGINGIDVINNVRWGTSESFEYCFSGLPKNSILAIGTCGGNPHRLIDRTRFEEGLEELIRRLQPTDLIIYGGGKYSCLEALKDKGVTLHIFPSATNAAYKRKHNE